MRRLVLFIALQAPSPLLAQAAVPIRLMARNPISPAENVHTHTRPVAESLAR
jgi:hypothetical protein